MQFKRKGHKVYSEDKEGNIVAEIDFPQSADGTYIFNHTYVHPDLRGMGIADRLARKATEHVRNAGGKASAVCPYIKSWLKKHPEKADIFIQVPS